MVADLNVHWPVDAQGEAKPHAHVMLTLREAGPEGFGRKVRAWNGVTELQGWREAWATRANERLAELGHEIRIDHRSSRIKTLRWSRRTRSDRPVRAGRSGARRPSARRSIGPLRS